MTPFIELCSFVTMLSLALMIFFIVLLRVRRIQGKEVGPIAMLLLILAVLFVAGVVIIGITYK